MALFDNRYDVFYYESMAGGPEGFDLKEYANSPPVGNPEAQNPVKDAVETVKDVGGAVVGTVLHEAGQGIKEDMGLPRDAEEKKIVVIAPEKTEKPNQRPVFTVRRRIGRVHAPIAAKTEVSPAVVSGKK